MKLRGLALFAGLHSFARALRDFLDVEVVETFDFMPEAVESGRLNGFNATQADVRTVNFGLYVDIDLVVGGPPCQPFSQSANNDGEFDPRDMIPEFIRCVAETFPKLFVMEEVQTLTWKKHRAYFDKVVSSFEALGYVVEARIINTADHGVGQARKRLIVIGRRVDTIVFGPKPIYWPKPKPHVTMAEVLNWDSTDCWKRNQLAPEPARVEAWDVRADWPLHRPSTTVVGSYRPDVQAAPGYRRAGDGPRQNTPGSVVTTHEERLILQGLPVDWKVAGSIAKRDLQVGNSCPTIVMADIIRVNLMGLS